MIFVFLFLTDFTLFSRFCMCGMLSLFSHVRLFVTLWTVAHQAPLSIAYWSGKPFPIPGDLPDPGIKPRSLALQAHSLPSQPPGKPPRSRVMLLSMVTVIQNGILTTFLILITIQVQSIQSTLLQVLLVKLKSIT